MEDEDKSLEEVKLEALKALKDEKEALELKAKKLEDENKKMLVNFVENRAAPVPEQLKSAKDYAKAIMEGKNFTNRQFFENSVNYRKAMLSEFNIDPWSDNGEVTEETNQVSTAVESLLDEYKDDFSFRNALHNVMRDDPKLLARLKAARSK